MIKFLCNIGTSIEISNIGHYRFKYIKIIKLRLPKDTIRTIIDTNFDACEFLQKHQNLG